LKERYRSKQREILNKKASSKKAGRIKIKLEEERECKTIPGERGSSQSAIKNQQENLYFLINKY